MDTSCPGAFPLATPEHEIFSRVVHSTEVELRSKLSKATDLDMILEVITDEPIALNFSNVHDSPGSPRLPEQDSRQMFPPPLCFHAEGSRQPGSALRS